MLTASCSSKAVDRLDPHWANDIGKDQGNAVGDQYSGEYAYDLSLTTCDCPVVAWDELNIEDPAGLPIEEGENVDACGILWDLDAMQPPQANTQVTVVHTDGTVAWPHWFPALSGPIDEDGSFIVAGTGDLSQILARAELVTLVEGTVAAGVVVLLARFVA